MLYLNKDNDDGNNGREGCLWQEEEAAEVAAVVAAVASVGLVVAVVAVVLVDAVADHSVVVVAEALGVVAVLGAAEVTILVQSFEPDQSLTHGVLVAEEAPLVEDLIEAEVAVAVQAHSSQ